MRQTRTAWFTHRATLLCTRSSLRYGSRVVESTTLHGSGCPTRATGERSMMFCGFAVSALKTFISALAIIVSLFTALITSALAIIASLFTALITVIPDFILRIGSVRRTIGRGRAKDGREAGWQRCVEGRDPPTCAVRQFTHRSMPVAAVQAASSYPAVACTRTGRSQPRYSLISGDHRCANPDSSASCLYRPKIPRSQPWFCAYCHKCDERLTASAEVTTGSQTIAFNRPLRSRPQMLPGLSSAA